MNYILLSLSVVSTVTNSALLNVTGKKLGLHSTAAKAMFNGIIFAVIVLGITVLSGGIRSVTFPTVLFGVIFGIMTAVTNITTLLSYETGPMNFTVLIVYCMCILMPTLVGPLVWPDSNPVRIVQWCGVAILIVSLILGIKSSDGMKFSAKWLMFVAVAAVTCGSLGIIQQAHQKSDGRKEMYMMLIIAFASASLLCFVYALISAKFTGENPVKGMRGVHCAVSAASGVCMGFTNVANLFLSGVLPAVLFFPVVNGGVVTLSALVSLVLFKEKLNLRQSIGLIMGIASMILICGVV